MARRVHVFDMQLLKSDRLAKAALVCIQKDRRIAVLFQGKGAVRVDIAVVAELGEI